MHGGEFLNQEHGGRGVVYNTGDVVTMSVDKENGVLSYQVFRRVVTLFACFEFDMSFRCTFVDRLTVKPW